MADSIFANEVLFFLRIKSITAAGLDVILYLPGWKARLANVKVAKNQTCNATKVMV